jgi:hypothetical protein
MNNKLIILHFQPLEKYPPVMNFINVAAKTNQFQIIVCTTPDKESSWFSNPDCKIYRFGPGLENKLTRALTYFLYNILSFCVLLIKNPDIIFYYETLSSFPVNFYSFLRSNFRLFIHYHEYVSNEERKQSSFYFRLLNFSDNVLLKKAQWVSQTNDDRCKLFKQDFPFIKTECLHSLPNFPPSSWVTNFKNYEFNNTFPIRIVLVGAVGMKTLYLEEFAIWVNSMKGKVIWDIYSNNYSKEVVTFFKKFQSEFINLKPSVSYYELPVLLRTYHIGVVLYKGHIPNVIYCVPNKVFEYLSCGLEVWCSDELISVRNYLAEHSDVPIHMLNFNSDFFEKYKLTQGAYLHYNYSFENTAENSYKHILNLMY